MRERGSIKEMKLTLAGVLTAYEQQVLRDDVLRHSQSQEHLEGYGDVLAFLADRGGMHREYKHYGTRARIAGILGGGALYLTDRALLLLIRIPRPAMLPFQELIATELALLPSVAEHDAV